MPYYAIPCVTSRRVWGHGRRARARPAGRPGLHAAPPWLGEVGVQTRSRLDTRSQSVTGSASTILPRAEVGWAIEAMYVTILIPVLYQTVTRKDNQGGVFAQRTCTYETSRSESNTP